MIEFEIPGETGKDNCVAVCVSTGTENHRLLLECCGRLPRAQLLATRFLHFHFDHYADFDEQLRAVWFRECP